MAKRLEGKVAIITGASRGIGRVTALALAKEGCNIVVAAKSEESTDNLPGSIHSVAAEVETLGSKALAQKVDVRDDHDIHKMIERTVEVFGRIDILMNNAGALWWQDVLDTPIKRYDLMMALNARAPFLCSQLAAPHMIKAGGGHIVMCSPPVDLDALPGKTGYLMSKFGATMLAEGLAAELRDKNVSVNSLWPVTAIESQATINFNLGGPAMWRKADILADCMVAIATTPPKDLTGRALLDEDFLRERGVTDFVKYRCDPNSEPPRFLAKDIPRTGHAKR